jgi:hypothetical protein
MSDELNENEVFEKYWYRPLYANINGDGTFDKDMFRYKDLGKNSANLAWIECASIKNKIIIKLKTEIQEKDEYIAKLEAQISRDRESLIKEGEKSEVLKKYLGNQKEWIND